MKPGSIILYLKGKESQLTFCLVYPPTFISILGEVKTLHKDGMMTTKEYTSLIECAEVLLENKLIKYNEVE